MATTIPVTQNPILGDSALGSDWFKPSFLFNQGVLFFQQFFDFLSNNGASIIASFNNILFFISLFFLTLISYCAIRMLEIRSKEKKHLKHEIAEYAHHQTEREKKLQQGEAISKNERWIKTLNYLFSQHQSDWKLAVIEADSMLESLMNQLGYKGDNLGEKLKG